MTYPGTAVAIRDPTVVGLEAYNMSPAEAFVAMGLLLLLPFLEGLSKLVHKFESKEVSYQVTRTPEKNFDKVHEPYQVRHIGHVQLLYPMISQEVPKHIMFE